MTQSDSPVPAPAKVPPRYPPKVATEPVAPAATGVIVARHSREYRVRRYIVVAMFLIFSAWFAYDGWKKWPLENKLVNELEYQLDAARGAHDTDKVAQLSEELRKHKRHTDTDVGLQRFLAISIPLASLLALGVWLARSRGEYRLTPHTLSAPGHGEVPLSSVRRLHKSLWDRKGIAYVEYELPGTTQARRIKLDDFVYDREATDEIFRRIEMIVTATPADEETSASDAGPR